MKTLVLYVFHEYNANVDFFLKHGGIIEHPDIDYLFIINHPTLTIATELPKNARVVNRDNIGYDFGAWSHGLFMESPPLYSQYDYFVLINSSVRGPFFPLWSQDRNWVTMFTRYINDDVKLVGTTINHVCAEPNKKIPHVQSMVMVSDRIGIDIGIRKGIFTINHVDLPKLQVVIQKEVAFSSYILDAGYNLACLLEAYRGYDFRVHKQRPTDFSKCQWFVWDDNPYRSKNYFGMDIHPYEVIFIKVSPWTSHLLPIVNLYTQWENRGDKQIPSKTSPQSVSGQPSPPLPPLPQSAPSPPLPQSAPLPPLPQSPQSPQSAPPQSVPPSPQSPPSSAQSAQSEPFDRFNWEAYLILNPDVAKVSTTQAWAIRHWRGFGYKEQRKYYWENGKDKWITYLDRYPELRLNGVTTQESAVDHYIRYGKTEGRIFT